MSETVYWETEPNPINICLDLGVLKTLLYFNVPTCWNLFVVLFAYRVAFFLHVPFQLHSPQFILAIRLLKILHGKLELSTTMDNIIISKPRCPYLTLSLV